MHRGLTQAAIGVMLGSAICGLVAMPASALVWIGGGSVFYATDYSASSQTMSYLRFEEASGAAVDEKGNTWGETGTTTRDTGDFKEGAQSMGGVSGTNYQQCTTTASCQDVLMPAAATDFSFGCWAKLTNNTTTNKSFWNSTRTGGGYGAHFRPTSAGKDLRCEFRGASTQYVGNDNNNDNQWYHAVCTYDDTGTGATIKLFTDGAETATLSPTSWEMSTAAASTYIPSQSSSQFTGLVDECWMLEGTALAAAQACQICSCGFKGTGCTCDGDSATYLTTGNNASLCGSCTLAACNAAAP